MKKINLIAASRQRPVRMTRVFKKWMENAKNPELIKTIISIDSDDSLADQYHLLLDPIAEHYNSELSIIINDNKCTVDAINSCKSHIDGDLILVFSDDTDCFLNWDEQIINFSERLNGKYIIKTSDCIGKTLITMPIFSKEYLDSFDYVYHPSYKHMFCDTELTCVAYLLDCVVDCNKFEFKHLHYTQLHHDRDAIDDKNQSTFYEGMSNFILRLGNNFNIDNELIRGKIPEEILEFISERKDKK